MMTISPVSLTVKPLPSKILAMTAAAEEDAVDRIVADVRRVRPDLHPDGLPIAARVLRLAEHLRVERERELALHGLSVGDFDVLASLRRRSESGPVKVRDLQRWTMLSSGGMTKRLDRLERLGHLRRLDDPADRRGVLIELTPQGLSIVDDALTSVTRLEAAAVTSALPSAASRCHVEEGLRRLLLAHDG
jgi:DNA-binding MarR family transcriptional regulator